MRKLIESLGVAMESSEDRQIADTILDQMGGKRKISMMTGAYFIVIPKGVFIQFPQPDESKPNAMRVVLDIGSDTYDVEFLKVEGTRKKVVEKMSDVYFDMLMDLFEKYTGLYLTLYARR